MLDGLVDPHNSIPYVLICLMVSYIVRLIATESRDLLSRSPLRTLNSCHLSPLCVCVLCKSADIDTQRANYICNRQRVQVFIDVNIIYLNQITK